MAGPGKDNITGDRYTLDLGVEPDLGNLLQNLTVANKLLDEAENKFKAISTVVGSTTQRVNELTRATQLFVTQTQRIRNEYQGIADASARIGDLSAVGQVGGPVIGAGMSPSATNQMIAQSMMAGMQQVREPGQVEETKQPAIRPPNDGKGLTRKDLYISRFIEDFVKDRILPTPKKSSAAQKAADAKKPDGTKQRPFNVKDIDKQKRPNVADAARKRKDALGEYTDEQTIKNLGFDDYDEIIDPLAPSSNDTALGAIGKQLMAGSIGDTIKRMGYGGLATKAIELVNGPFGKFAQGAYFVNKIAKNFIYNPYAQIAQQAQGYTELTGGTSIAESGGYGSYIPFAGKYLSQLSGLKGEELQAAALGGEKSGIVGRIGALMGYEDPTFSKEQSREAMALALGAGYQQDGDMRRDLTAFLKFTTKAGFGDMRDNLDIYSEVVDKADGATSSLTTTIERLKKVAKESDMSIQSLAANLKKQVETLTGMGMNGSSAAAYAGVAITQYQNAQTQVVRNSVGPDLASPYMRARMADYFGTSYTAMPAIYAQGVVEVNGQQMSGVTATAQASDAVIAETLNNMGFTPGMTSQEILEKVTVYGPVLSQMGVMPPDIDPMDAAAVRDWIMRYTGGAGQAGKGYLTPATDANEDRLEGAKATALGGPDAAGSAKNQGVDIATQTGTWAAIGAGAGSFIPGVGTVAGGLIGGAAGFVSGLVGSVTNDFSYEALEGVDYTAGVGGINLADRSDEFGGKASAVEQWYENQLNNKKEKEGWLSYGNQGAMAMPIMNELLSMSDRDLSNVYVTLDGQRVNLANALSGDTKQPLTKEQQEQLMAGLRGEQEVEYGVKDSEGNITSTSTLSNLANDNKKRKEDEEAENKPDGSKSKPFYITQDHKGAVDIARGIVDPGGDGWFH